jgi:hypothetical protein
MDIGRLLLCAGVILAPPLAWSVVVIVYTHRRRARLRAGRVPVAEVIERVTRDRRSPQDASPSPTPEGLRAEGLPPGWHWPTRDPDPPGSARDSR